MTKEIYMKKIYLIVAEINKLVNCQRMFNVLDYANDSNLFGYVMIKVSRNV